MAAKKKTSKKTTTTRAAKAKPSKASGLCRHGCGVEQIPGATFCHHCNCPQ